MLYLFTFLSQSWGLQVPENSRINQSDRLWRLEPTLEIGFLAPLSHKIKFGKEGTDFDYIADGGQDNLFRYTRWEMNFRGHNKHNLRLLFQPAFSFFQNQQIMRFHGPGVRHHFLQSDQTSHFGFHSL